MKVTNIRHFVLGIAVLAPLALGGCVVEPNGYYAAAPVQTQYYSDGSTVTYAQPAYYAAPAPAYYYGGPSVYIGGGGCCWGRGGGWRR